MNILVNGCSFMDNWHYAHDLRRLLSADVINLAKPGSCNRRIIRTTVDHIQKNPVDLVIIGLTFYDRQEGPFLVQPKEREGHWVSYNSQGLHGTFIESTDACEDATYKMVDDYVKDRYRFDIGPKYLEQLYLDIEMFTGYLCNKGIAYCIINMCDKHHNKEFSDPGIVPLSFIANEFMEGRGVQTVDADKSLPPNARHHYGPDTICFTEYVVDYIKKNNILYDRNIYM